MQILILFFIPAIFAQFRWTPAQSQLNGLFKVVRDFPNGFAITSASGTNRYNIFTVVKHTVYRGSWSSDSFTDFRSVDGNIVSRLAAVNYKDGGIAVFGRGEDDNLNVRFFDGDNAGWYNLKMKMDGAPCACSYSENRIDVFFKGSNGYLYRTFWTGGPRDQWSQPTKIGDKKIKGRPSCVSWGSDFRIDIVARLEGSSDISHKYFPDPANQWSEWKGLGLSNNYYVDEPTITSRGKGLLDVLFQDIYAWKMYVKSYSNNAWSDIIEQSTLTCSWTAVAAPSIGYQNQGNTPAPKLRVACARVNNYDLHYADFDPSAPGLIQSPYSAENEATQNAENEATQNAENEATQNAENEATQNVENEAIQNAEDEAIQNAEDEAIQNDEDEAIQNDEDEAIQNAEDEAIQYVEDEAIEYAENDISQGSQNYGAVGSHGSQSNGLFVPNAVVGLVIGIAIFTLVVIAGLIVLLYKNN